MNYEKMTKTELIKRLELRDELASEHTGELRECKERFSALFELLSVGVAQIETRTGIFFKVNKKYCDIVGYTREEMTKKTFMDITHPDDIKADLNNMKEMKKGNISEFVMEKRYFHKNGTIVWVDLNVFPMWSAVKKQDFHIAIVHDITVRKRMEVELCQDRNFLQNIFDGIQDGISVLDKDLNVLKVNRTMEEWYPHVLPLHGKKCFKAYQGRSGPCTVCPTIRAIETGKLQMDVVPFTGPKERLGWQELFAFPLKDEKNNVTGVIEYVRDITGRKRAESLLKIRESQQREISVIGKFALTSKTKLTLLMNMIVNSIVKTLDVEYCKILELLPDGKTLLLRAGVGWKEGHVGKAIVSTGKESQAGYTLASASPVIVKDLKTETRFNGLELLHDHGVVSGISTIIYGEGVPYGILGVHTIKKLVFTEDDVSFVQSIANILSEAIKRNRSEELLHGQKKALEQKNIALSEVLGQLEIEKKQIKDNITANAENLILPIIQKLKLAGISHKYLELLQANIQELTSSFGAKVSSRTTKLTPKEIELCDMIKNGFTNKEMAKLLNISIVTVEKHRNNIRRKLNIVNKDINLSSVLKTL